VRRSLTALIALGVLLLAATAAQAATIQVTTTLDTPVGTSDGQCSLREAVLAARFDATTPATFNCTPGSGDDLVQLEAGDYRLAAGGPNEDGGLTGDLDTGPSGSLRIAGRGMGVTVVGGAGDRIFDVAAGASLGLSDLTVRDGIVSDGANGGAVRNLGAFTALRVAFLNSAAGDGHTPTASNDQSSPGGGGGAIWSQGQLQVADSLFSGDRAGDGSRSATFNNGAAEFGARDGGDGGAILVTAGNATLSGVTISGSRAGDGRDDLPQTIFAGGSAGRGGGIAVTGGSMTVVNSTFQGNRAGNAGSPRFGNGDEAIAGSGGATAAVAPGSISITFSTFAGNAVGTGPGGTGVGASVLGAIVGGSVLADAGGACATPTPGLFANVVLPGDTSCPGAKIPGDPRLGPLAANGGPTPTMLPGAGSAAINALVGVPCPGTDQRGLPRPALGGCDAGAVEVQPAEPGAAGVGRGGADAAAKRVSGLSMSATTFRAAGSGGSVAAPTGKSLQAKAPIGTTVRYRLDGAARVTFTITKPVPGRRKGKRCVVPKAAKPGAKRCIRTTKLPGSFVHQGVAGPNSFRFTGRLRGRKLAPGRYILTARLPRPATGKAALARTAFRIVR
jgi:CSLREA domain-containing protein